MPYIGLEHIEKDTGRIVKIGNSSEVRSTKTSFNSGDLLYGKLRPYLNKVTVVNFNGICSTEILVFPKRLNISNKFLKYRFLNQDFVRYTSQNMSGVQHPRVDFKIIARFPIALPPFLEQEKIAEKIERHFSIIETTLDTVEKNLKLSEGFRQSILKKAFEGRLVPQDPTDESAEKLLERIKMEKARDKVEETVVKVEDR
jgi:type I restriction enzyme S subunit